MLKPRLNPGDLRRFRAVFERHLRRFLPGHSPMVGPAPEPGADLETPLIYRGRPLGRLSLFLEPGAKKAPPQVAALLPAVAASALELVSLHKALVTDRQTGLGNRDFFMSRLCERIRLSESEPRTLKSWEDEGRVQLVLALFEIDPKPGQRGDLRALAETVGEIDEIAALARLGDRRLGCLFQASPGEAKARLERIRGLALTRFGDLSPLSAFALFPGDLALDPAAPFQSRLEAANALMERAATALAFAASRRRPAPVIGFGELVGSHGQVVQILPQDRVIINLGRSMGALPGQVFAVRGEDSEPKGEITVFEAGEAWSLAHVTAGRSARLSAGDRLAFSRMDWTVEPGEELEARASFEREGFVKNLVRLAAPDRPLTLAMVRLDDHERLAAVAGPAEVKKRLDLLMSSALEDERTAPEILVAWGPGTAALAWASVDPASARSRAEALIASLKGSAPASAGLVHWPAPTLRPESLVAAGLKALVEAAMTGPETAISFGPQTLNISGDRLFDEGDVEGAAEEYRQGLAMDPPAAGRLNLLNSLGVCHGRLGDQKAATEAFDEVLAIDPSNLMARFNQGCSHLLAGRLEEALEAFEKAEAIEPDNFQVLFNLGKTALELGRFERSLGALAKASEHRERNGRVHRLLGQARLLSGDRDGALASFKRAVKFNPDDADSLSSLGALFLDSANDQEVALSLFQRSVELDPTNSLFRRRLGMLLYQLGDFPAAERHLRLAVEYGCREEDVRRSLAGLTASDDDYEEMDPPAGAADRPGDGGAGQAG
jgi:tetratricopeptide (TPR) repeat protein